MRTLGLRHVALNVPDPQRTADFYVRVMGMTVEWQPDADNIYATTEGFDNLAIHKEKEPKNGAQCLDHIGFAVAEAADVDAWFAHLNAHDVPIVAPPKTHRDGARSLYCRDPDGVVVQIIHHPPIAARALAPPTSATR